MLNNMEFYYRIFYSRKNIRKFKLLPENSQAYLHLKNRPLIKHSVRCILLFHQSNCIAAAALASSIRQLSCEEIGEREQLRNSTLLQ